jgi:hypothetical protein
MKESSPAYLEEVLGEEELPIDGAEQGSEV